jgi:hypothetical protein
MTSTEVGVDATTGHPIWVLRRGLRQTVAAIESDRSEPERRLIRIRLQTGERLLLVQRRTDARWSVTPVAPPFGPAAV